MKRASPRATISFCYDHNDMEFGPLVGSCVCSENAHILREPAVLSGPSHWVQS